MATLTTTQPLLQRLQYMCQQIEYMYSDLHRVIQCRHLIAALNAWAAWAKYTTACPFGTQFPGHGCMYDLTTKRTFDSQTTWVIDMHGKNILKCYSWKFIQPGIGGRTAVWCMN